MSNFDQIYSDILVKLPAKVRQVINQSNLRELVSYVQLFEHESSKAKREALQLRSLLDYAQNQLEKLETRVKELEVQAASHNEELLELGRQIVPQDLPQGEDHLFQVTISRELRYKLHTYARGRLIEEGEKTLSGNSQEIAKGLETYLASALAGFVGRSMTPGVHDQIKRTLDNKLRALGTLPPGVEVVVTSDPFNESALKVDLVSDLSPDEHDKLITRLDQLAAGR